MPLQFEFCRLLFWFSCKWQYINVRFYRTMHCSAECGIEIACHPSVCLSVCNVGVSGPHRLEILETNCMVN